MKTQTEQKATPKLSVSEEKIVGEGAGQRVFLLVDEGMGGDEAIGEIYTDSALYKGRMDRIVKAVNSHDGLVWAVDGLLKVLDRELEFKSGHALDIISEARKFLAKAEARHV